MPPNDNSSSPFRSRDARVNAPRMPEQLVAEDRAVDQHKDGATARTLVVDRPGDQLLLGAGFSLNDHRERRGSDAGDLGLEIAQPAVAGQDASAAMATPRRSENSRRR